MSWLRFARTSFRIELYAGEDVGNREDSPLLGSWPADAQSAMGSSFSWPDGQHLWSHYSPVSQQPGTGEGHPITAFGFEGVHVFKWNGINGVGVQAMRSKTTQQVGAIGRLTIGAIKINDIGMSQLNGIQQGDPLKALVIEP